MQIKCLGGFREVGRNAVLIENKEKIVFDYGVKVETAELPILCDPDVVLLAHAHLDHSGAIPILYRKKQPPVYSTVATFDLTHLILKDSMKVSRLKGYPQRFTEKELNKTKENEARVTYGQQIETNHATIDVYDAGHIPGSCVFLLDTGKKRILYTSDFNLRETRLLSGAKINAKNIDVLLIESTYASKDHPPRIETEKEFYKTIKGTILNDGIALLPSFAVGRAAEILMILDKYKPDFPVYLDGMAKQATEIALRYPEFIKDAKALGRALRKVDMIYSNVDRNHALKEPCAIITTGGCLEGGPVVHYIKKLYTETNSSLIFTGFQIPKTAGRYLLDTGRYVTEGLDLKVKMNIKFFDFSAHAGRKELFDFVHKLNPKKVICMHGEHCQRFAQELRSRGFDASAPKNGDEIKI